MALISNSHICPHLVAILSMQTEGTAMAPSEYGWVVADQVYNQTPWHVATVFLFFIPKIVVVVGGWG